MKSDRIIEHEGVGLALVRALQAVTVEEAGVFRGVVTSEQFQAILAGDPKDAYWSSFASSSDERCPTAFETRFRDLANDLCGTDEGVSYPEIEELVEGVLNSWWVLVDEGIYRPRDNEFYRFQSNALQSALRRGSAWFGSLSALRGLLASPCHAATALQQQKLDTEKLGRTLKGIKDFGIDSVTPLMERAFDIANGNGEEVPSVCGQHLPRKVGTGHLLLAMLEDRDTRASQLLNKLQVDSNQVRAFLTSLPSEL